ncbi:MAG TPA: UDP-N-acetylglucosamine 1-carboxyvinyltransferase [bacterium]|nr:UDP-N-acetylglucosamine 1-carboxyvinyltransferase [bacterium]
MEKFIIEGGKKLEGEIAVSGSKNAALPVIAASLMAEGKSVIHNIPDVKDVRTMIKILNSMGVGTSYERNTIEIDPASINKFTAPYEFVSTMRGSVCLLGPLVAKYGQAVFSMPGGCVIGSRPVDLHVKGLKKLGANIVQQDGNIISNANKLEGSTIFLGGNFGSSVLATANIMMAAVLAKGETLIECAACEPEIVDLAKFLKKMGARIYGEGSHFLRIEGVRKLSGVEYTIVPDRIEACTYVLAGYMNRGIVGIKGVVGEHILSFLDVLEDAGINVKIVRDTVWTEPNLRWKSVDVTTLPYPGFPTDLQAQIMTFLSMADGVSVITEKVFPERFIHVGELNRLGANISIDGARAIVRGVKRLNGARVMASDLRASAALVLAGLVAEGRTEVARIYHLDRGYERFEEKLRNLGAVIERVN